MVLNMDTELQRLICVSVEKMSSDSAGNGSRKSRGLDLRKALLVAHVLQDMRSAYMTDDYKVLVNTVCPDITSENEMEKIKRKFLRTEYDEDDITLRKRKFVTDDWSTGAVERPPRSEGDDVSFMTSQYRCPSMSQSCLLTCSDATMSKFSQMTHPIPVSMNTSYVLSHQTSEKEDNEDLEIDEDTPSVSEQVEVTSSESDSEPVEIEIVQCEEILNTGADIMEFSENTRNITVNETILTKSQEISTKPSCPLPRKKRPLPKEFLEPTIEDISSEQQAKRTKSDAIVTSTSSDVIITSSHCMNTTTATTLTQSSALSRSNSSQSHLSRNSNYSTLTSSVCTMSVVSSSTRNTIADSNSENKPKVVVEKMTKQSSISGLWPWSLPVTCTQPRLSSWVADGVYRAQLVDISNSIHTVGMQGLVAY